MGALSLLLQGLPLLMAGRQVTDLLMRNLLKTVGVWWCV